jgi:hypothetical protein
MRRALVRAATSHALVALAVLLVGAGLAAGALVGFSADTQTQTSTLAGGWLAAPTALQTPTVRGNGATLTWTPSTHDVTAQSIYGTDRGTTNNCTGATYATAFDTGLAANTTTVNDDRGSSASGHWICYQARAEHGAWNKTANFPSVIQVGLVPTGITITNNSFSGSIAPSDTIDLFFNQNVTYSGSSPITVCAFSSAGRILIGDTGCASSNDTPTLARITGMTLGANRTFQTSTVSVSNNRVRITLNTTASGSSARTTASGTGSTTFTGSASIIQSSAGAASVCTAANCTWTWSGSF